MSPETREKHIGEIRLIWSWTVPIKDWCVEKCTTFFGPSCILRRIQSKMGRFWYIFVFWIPTKDMMCWKMYNVFRAILYFRRIQSKMGRFWYFFVFRILKKLYCSSCPLQLQMLLKYLVKSKKYILHFPIYTGSILRCGWWVQNRLSKISSNLFKSV